MKIGGIAGDEMRVVPESRPLPSDRGAVLSAEIRAHLTSGGVLFSDYGKHSLTGGMNPHQGERLD